MKKVLRNEILLKGKTGKNRLLLILHFSPMGNKNPWLFFFTASKGIKIGVLGMYLLNNTLKKAFVSVNLTFLIMGLYLKT